MVVITGANTGIGKETAIDLATRGGKVYIACRDKDKSREALEDIRKASNNPKASYLELDLASIESIKEFSKNFHELETHLHILVNNAGVMACPKSYTKDGFEMQIGTNHLGHFLLTNMLLDLLIKSSPSRIVVVASEGYKLGNINKDDIFSEKSYSKLKAYGQSKSANILFANELSTRLQGTGVTVNSCHPGIIRTELSRHMDSWLRTIYRPLLKPFYKTIHEGAQTSIRLAVDPDLDGVSGKYFADCNEANLSKAAKDTETAKWLWQKSSQVIVEKYPEFVRIVKN